MKLKKKTSMMLVAASTAAIIGIAAVSFAAWTGETRDTLAANAETGTVYAFGFGDVESFSFDGVNENETALLVPYDQDASTISAGSKTFLTADLPVYTVNKANYTITVSVDEYDADYALYVQLVDTAGEKLTQAPAEGSITEANEWFAVTEAGAKFEISYAEGDTVENIQKYLNLVLVSDGAAPAETVQFSLTVTLEQA